MQWHVLTGSFDGNTYQIAFHIPIPSVNNAVSVNYQTALINSGIGGKTVMASGTGPGQIGATELSQIQSGALFEHVETFFTNPSQTLAQATAALNARYTELSATSGPVIAPLQNELLYFGGVSAA